MEVSIVQEGFDDIIELTRDTDGVQLEDEAGVPDLIKGFFGV